MTRKIDLTQRRYGRLVVVAEHPGRRWECLCDCGQTALVLSVLLRNGKTKSCGCLRRELGAERGRQSRKHGEGADGRVTSEYRAWSNMLSRCQNANHAQFINYGARGITVCTRWGRYEDFLADMGRRPSPHHSLDRIDNDAGYSPDNCRWATYEEQNNNRRPQQVRHAYSQGTVVERAGVARTVREWRAHLGINEATFRSRVRKGMPLAKALFAPKMPPGRRPAH